jgi:hypothetical protein
VGIGQDQAVAGDDEARAFAAHGHIALGLGLAHARHAGHAEAAEEFEERIIGVHARHALLALACCGLVAIVSHGTRTADHADVDHGRAIARRDVGKVGRHHRTRRRGGRSRLRCRRKQRRGGPCIAMDHTDQTGTRGPQGTDGTRSHQGQDQTAGSGQNLVHGRPFLRSSVPCCVGEKSAGGDLDEA